MKQLLAIALPVFLLCACGGSEPGTAEAGAGGEFAVGESKGTEDGRLTLTIDGQEYTTEGGVQADGLHFKNKLFLGLSGDQPKVNDEPTKSLWLTMQKNSFEPGTFAFLDRENIMRNEPENTGTFVSLQFDGADSIAKSLEGSVTFDALVTEVTEKRTVVKMAKGSLKGNFRGHKGKIHEVSGTFEFYARQ